MVSSTTTAKTASTATFLTALTFNAIVFVVQIAAFTLIRPYFRRIYEPRAIDNQIHSLSYLSWPFQIAKADYRTIIKVNGLDAYFFVRFLRMLFRMFVPIWFISWAVLIPLTAVNTHVLNNDGLDDLAFGNVEPDKQIRYVGHIICVYLFTGWILFNIRREMSHYIITRQHHLIDKTHAKTTQANTILVTGIPIKYLNQLALRKVFDALPGGVKKIWINRNLKALPDAYNRRLNACNKLEAAETKLLASASKAGAKQVKKGSEFKEVDRDSIARPTHRLGFLGLFGKKVDSINWAREEIRLCTGLLEEGGQMVQAADEADSQKGMALMSKGIGGGWKTEDETATHIPQQHQDEVGGVDSHTSSKSGFSQQVSRASDFPKAAAHHAAEMSKQTAAKTKQTAQQAAAITKQAAATAKNLISKDIGNKEYPPLNSAFITFHRQIAAHLAVQCLNHHEPYRMSGKYIEVNPNDIIWDNLGLNPYEMKIRTAMSWGATIALIIFWSIPVSFVGVVSNIYTVCSQVSWLSWICKLGGVPVGIISGILPPVMLAVLMMLLPIVLRLFARFEGIPQVTGCELSLMNRYFSFQVVHTFLIVTISSGIIAALKGLLSNPGSIPSLLANKLPMASTFFLTYTLLQLASTAGGFLQIVTLIIYYVKLFILGSTPRSIWTLKYGKQSITTWGTIWPGVTVLVVITFGYSIISPVINGIACVTFALLYLLYKYLFLWVVDQSSTSDTGGLFFSKAIQHLFVGLYVQQICLAALFFLARDQNNKGSAVPEGALTIVLLLVTASFHLILNQSYGPLEHALPLTLADRMYSEPDVPVHSIGNEHDPEPGAALTPAGDSLEARQMREEKEDGYGFAHPAISRPQRTIWLPNDSYGWAEKEEEATREAEIDVARGSGASMNDKGSVEVEEMPGVPGE